MTSLRLQAITNMVPRADTLADIGCDHGKAALMLLDSYKVEKVICSDISSKSLEKAKMLFSTNKYEERVSIREGDGFNVLKAGEAEAAIIAGIGGELMSEILERGKDKMPDTLVLSCNSKPEALRLWLCKNGYFIEDEDLVYENDHFYPVILARKGNEKELTEIEIEFGPVLIKKRHKMLRKLLEERIKKNELELEEIKKSAAKRKENLISDINKKLEGYTEVLKCLYK